MVLFGIFAKGAINCFRIWKESVQIGLYERYVGALSITLCIFAPLS